MSAMNVNCHACGYRLCSAREPRAAALDSRRYGFFCRTHGTSRRPQRLPRAITRRGGPETTLLCGAPLSDRAFAAHTSHQKGRERLPRSAGQRKGAATPIETTMDVSHGRSARMSFDTAREMAKTLTPAQEIAHIENELRALGYTKTHEARQTKVTMKNPQYNPSTKTLEELRLQRRTATGVLPKSMEEHNIEKEVQEDGKVYRNARACTGGDIKMRYPGPHDRPKKDDVIPHYETPTKPKHVKGSGRRSASNNDDAEYWSDDGGSWQRSNKDSPGARRVGKSQGSPESISKSSLRSSSGAGNVESGRGARRRAGRQLER